jgi:hypothetical protein
LSALRTKNFVVNALEIARKESVTTSKFFDGLANDKGIMPAYEGLV